MYFNNAFGGSGGGASAFTSPGMDGGMLGQLIAALQERNVIPDTSIPNYGVSEESLIPDWKQRLQEQRPIIPQADPGFEIPGWWNFQNLMPGMWGRMRRDGSPFPFTPNDLMPTIKAPYEYNTLQDVQV